MGNTIHEVIFLTQQEYQHIKNLSWDLLVDAKISSLPVDIRKIAALYGLEKKMNHNVSRYENALLLANGILKIFGYNTDQDSVECLAIRILAPLMVLKELGVTTPAELSRLTDLPIDISQRRFSRYLSILERSVFGSSQLEQLMIKNFKQWINAQKNS